MEHAEAPLTIEELAHRTGMSVRNIRAYQSRGLIAPPTLRGRTGYYGDEHLNRLKRILEFQREGFKLAAIARFIEDAEDKNAEVLSLTRAAREPFAHEEPRQISAEELAKRWGAQGDPKLLRRAIELGLVRELGDGRFEERRPRLGDVGLELAQLGIDPHVSLDLIERAREHTKELAEACVELYLNEIWRPFEAEGRPDERLPEVREALERLRPLAFESLLAGFGLAMTDATEPALGREIEKIDERR